MSTNEQEKQPTIEELIGSLGNESIKRSHNSVNISFRQMLTYIDKIREPIPPGDINFLLKTYRLMAEMFYTQYEHSLLMEIVKQKDVKQYAEDAINYIGELRDNNPAKTILKAADPILVEDRAVAEVEYQKLTEQFPVLLQKALDKLRDEWQRVNTIAVASQALTKDEKLNRSIKAVVEVASHTVGIDAERIVIVPGNVFALYFFTYLDNFAVLTVPIYSVQAPWEWSIFWHELAGYKVRRLEIKATIDGVKKKLTAIHNLFKITDQEKMNGLLDSITLDNQFGRDYLGDLLFKERLVLRDLGGFDHQFVRMLLILLNTDTENPQIYDQIKTQGWCVDWFKELFEDAWSVLVIGEPFLEFFKDILGRNTAKDNRHPPLEVRLSVAKEILKLLNPQGGMVNEPSLMEKIAAEQILRFISLLMAAARTIESSDNVQSTSLQIYIQNIRDALFTVVKKEIQSSIKNWSGEFLSADDPSRKVKNSTKKFLEVFSDPELDVLLSNLDEYETTQIKSVYRALLRNKNYKQLLELSFYAVDYHTPGDVQLLESGKPYWVKRADWDSSIWLTQRHPVGNGKMPTEIIVREVDAQADWKVKIADWNGWFKMTQ